MDKAEAASAVRGIVHLSASLAGLEASSHSPERFVAQVRIAIDRNKVEESRRPEAIGNLLRWIAATLDEAQSTGAKTLSESTADAAKEKVCPVYPFD